MNIVKFVLQASTSRTWVRIRARPGRETHMHRTSALCGKLSADSVLEGTWTQRQRGQSSITACVCASDLYLMEMYDGCLYLTCPKVRIHPDTHVHVPMLPEEASFKHAHTHTLFIAGAKCGSGGLGDCAFSNANLVLQPTGGALEWGLKVECVSVVTPHQVPGNRQPVLMLGGVSVQSQSDTCLRGGGTLVIEGPLCSSPRSFLEPWKPFWMLCQVILSLLLLDK